VFLFYRGRTRTTIKVLDVLAVRAWVVSGCEEWRALQSAGGPPASVELLVVCEEDGTRTLGMLWWVAHWSGVQRAHCRAFLLEPEVVKRLRAILGAAAEAPPEHILHAFQHEIVAANFEVARLLTALPELEGEIQHPGPVARFGRLPIPAGCDAFPARVEPLQVVIVVHPKAEEDGSGSGGRAG
jgi:hypothetical protein